MSETEKRLIEELEAEYQEEFLKADKERTHRKYLNIGAVVGIIFVFISTSFEREFYTVLGTLGMGILQGASGLCVLMAVSYFLLPGVRDEERYKWKLINEKRKKIEELKKRY